MRLTIFYFDILIRQNMSGWLWPPSFGALDTLYTLYNGEIINCNENKSKGLKQILRFFVAPKFFSSMLGTIPSIHIEIIKCSYLSYKIPLSLKNSRKIAFYQVETSLLQPVAGGLINFLMKCIKFLKAPWCNACKHFCKKTFDKIAGTHMEKCKFYRICSEGKLL